MNILFLCEEYPPGRNGGIGTMVQVLGRELVRQGHGVFVVGLYPHGYAQQDHEEDEGVTIWRLRYSSDFGLIKNTFSVADNFWRKVLQYSTILHWDTKFSTKALFNFIEKIIELHHIDVIEMPDWNTFLHNSLSTVTIPPFKIPLTVKLHGSYSYLLHETGKPFHSRIFNTEKKLLHRADAVSSVSNYTATLSKKLFSLTDDITVLYNSMNIPSQTNSARSGNTIIFTGALVKTKGVHSLLKAWNIVYRQMPSLSLHLYGKGPVNELKKFIDADAISSVIFHGHVPREILLTALTTATVAVFPSHSECFSMAPLEAMAAGCAVVYTSRTSGPELITPNRNGLLIDPDDAGAIANAILLLINDEVSRVAIAKAGKALVEEKFNIEHSARQHAHFYTKVIEAFATK